MTTAGKTVKCFLRLCSCYKSPCIVNKTVDKVPRVLYINISINESEVKNVHKWQSSNGMDS